MQFTFAFQSKTSAVSRSPFDKTCSTRGFWSDKEVGVWVFNFPVIGKIVRHRIECQNADEKRDARMAKILFG